MQQCLPTRTVPCKLIVKDWNVLPEPECEFELGMEQEMGKGLWRQCIGNKVFDQGYGGSLLETKCLHGMIVAMNYRLKHIHVKYSLAA